MKKKLILIFLILAALVVFSVVRDLVIKNVVAAVASSITGAPTHIGGFSLSIMRQTVKVTDFRMYNPKDFPRDILVDIHLMRVNYDILTLLRGKIHLKELVLDLKEIGLVKNKDGKLNVDSLKIAEAKGEEKKPSKQIAMQIGLVQLNIGRVVSKDYSVSGGHAVKVYDLGIKKTYKDITSAQQLAALIISEPLKAAGIRGAKIYGAMMLTGVAALPVTAAFTITGKDHAQADYNVAWDKAYEAGLAALKAAGKVSQEDKTSGIISAEVNGVQVALKIKKVSEKATQITVSSRKFMFPHPEVAAGVMYRIQEELKK